MNWIFRNIGADCNKENKNEKALILIPIYRYFPKIPILRYFKVVDKVVDLYHVLQ